MVSFYVREFKALFIVFIQVIILIVTLALNFADIMSVVPSANITYCDVNRRIVFVRTTEIVFLSVRLHLFLKLKRKIQQLHICIAEIKFLVCDNDGNNRMKEILGNIYSHILKRCIK